MGLHEQARPSADHAMARFDYADVFLHLAGGWNQPSVPALLNRALEVAEAADATALIPRILAISAEDAFLRGQINDGSPSFNGGGRRPVPHRMSQLCCGWPSTKATRCSSSPRSSGPPRWHCGGVDQARQAGLEASLLATILAFNASEALLARGCTAEAAALIDRLTAGPPDRVHRLVQEARAEIDLLARQDRCGR